jgi:uncharacterized protein
MKCQTVYFENAGPQNTEETLKLVSEWADRLDVETVLVASTSGETGVMAVERLKPRNVVVVTHAAGFSEDNVQDLLPRQREIIESSGGKILTCQHALAGISRAVRLQFDTYQLDEIVANVLRLFGQGIKVATEITLMAADAGLVRTDRDVIAMAGSGSGADAAIVIRPANVAKFFNLKIRGILCKPWDS